MHAMTKIHESIFSQFRSALTTTKTKKYLKYIFISIYKIKNFKALDSSI